MELPRLGRSGLGWRLPGKPALKAGPASLARHPLFRTVSLDRAFYHPLTASQYAAYAAQVSDDFRFVVKAPALVTDATVCGEKGQAVQANPAFLSPELAVQEFVQPALQGLQHKLGVLVFQISPLPAILHSRVPELLQKLAAVLHALRRCWWLRWQRRSEVSARIQDGLVKILGFDWHHMLIYIDMYCNQFCQSRQKGQRHEFNGFNPGLSGACAKTGADDSG